MLTEDEVSTDDDKDNNDKDQENSQSVASNLNSSFKSIQLTPEPSTHSTVPSEASTAKVTTPAASISQIIYASEESSPEPSQESLQEPLPEESFEASSSKIDTHTSIASVKSVSTPAASLSNVEVSRKLENSISKESLSPSGFDMSVPDYSFTTARGDKSSLISDKSMEGGRESVGTAVSTRSGRSRASLASAKTPATAEKEIPEIPKTNLPSSIKKNGRASVDRRVSFNASIDLSPADTSSGMNDLSTVKEDQSYDISSRTSALASSAGTPSINRSSGLSPATSPPNKSFSNKSIGSILDASTQISIHASPSATTPTSPNSSRASAEKSNLSSVSKKSVKSTAEKSRSKSQLVDKSDEDEAQVSVSNISKSKLSAKSSILSPPSTVKSSRNTSRVSSSSKKSLKLDDEEEEENDSEIEVTKDKSEDEENEDISEHLSSSKISRASRSFESTRTSPKTATPKSSVKDDSLPAEESLEEDIPPVDLGGYDDELPVEEENQDHSISRISTSKSVTSTPRLSERGDLSSVKQTPKSAQSSAKKLSTPGSAYTEAISTPGSNEFPRGRRISDESFHINDSSILQDEDGGSDRSTDKEELDASAFSPSRGNANDKKGKGKKKGRSSKVETETADITSTDLELSESFIDKSFLDTISSANKKYAGKAILEQTKQLKKEEKKKEKLAEVRHKKRKSQVSDEEEDQDRYFDDDEDEDYDDDEEAGHLGLRRSRRATKGRRFAFWKGERPIYQEGTVVGVVEVEPTPKKKSKGLLVKRSSHAQQPRDNKRKRSSKTEETEGESENEEEEDEGTLRLVSKRKKAKTSTADEASDIEELPRIILPKQYNYLPAAKTDAFQVYDNLYEQITKESVVCSRAALPPPQPLPCPDNRPSGNKRVGAARHLFHVAERPGSMPGWFAGKFLPSFFLLLPIHPFLLLGFMDLPPLAIKDPENVGPLAQIFFVSDCQPESVEFALANPEDDDWDDRTAQRVILSAGDSFYVPPGNMYRLENHSKVKTCKINWVIIKPMQEIEAVGGSSVSHAPQIKR